MRALSLYLLSALCPAMCSSLTRCRAPLSGQQNGAHHLRASVEGDESSPSIASDADVGENLPPSTPACQAPTSQRDVPATHRVCPSTVSTAQVALMLHWQRKRATQSAESTATVQHLRLQRRDKDVKSKTKASPCSRSAEVSGTSARY